MVGVVAVVGSGDGSVCVVLLMGLCVWLCVALLMGLCVWFCEMNRCQRLREAEGKKKKNGWKA